MRRILALLCLGALGACTTERLVDADTTAGVVCEMDRVVGISPADTTLHIGDSLHVVATRFTGCASDTPVAATFRWASSDTTVATVDSAGLAVARHAGTATLVATDVGDANDKAAMLLQVIP